VSERELESRGQRGGAGLAAQRPKNAAVELVAHEGYIGCCRFQDTNELLSASGDSSCLLWDIGSGLVKNSFRDHTGDVMSVAFNGTDNNVFVSGAADATVKLWDVRMDHANSALHTYQAHESDVHSVTFFPDGNAVGTASDDGTCALVDLRYHGKLAAYGHSSILCGLSQSEFSVSGRLLFAACDDNNTYVFDTLSGTTGTGVRPNEYLHRIEGHRNRVSCLGVNVDGEALVTGSWDTTLKVWA
jgi:guanine nucleotide-binding protein G(I)/G(S)/G(T) subunit beta-1